jgi:hypothetical protein
MKKILLSIYPVGEISEIDLTVITERMARVQDWMPELHDARVSDASFVNVVIDLPELSTDTVRRLRRTFDHMPRMKTRVWNGHGDEIPLGRTNIQVLAAAAESFSRV